MRIVTFNIRLDNGQDGINNFCNRKAFILEKLKRECPDIICFQEVLPHVAIWLKEELTEYYIVGCGRDEKLRDEQVAIAYRKDRMNLMRMETYWLSTTPYVPASRYPDQSICPRVCTEVVMEDMETGLVFRIANTHLDHEGPKARIQGLAQILKHIEQASFFPHIPVIITGDMNAEPDSEEMAVLKNYPSYTNTTEDIGITYHGYYKTQNTCQIDYIIISEGLTCEKIEKWTDEKNGLYLSDHYPICATVYSV